MPHELYTMFQPGLAVTKMCVDFVDAVAMHHNQGTGEWLLADGASIVAELDSQLKVKQRLFDVVVFLPNLDKFSWSI